MKRALLTCLVITLLAAAVCAYSDPNEAKPVQGSACASRRVCETDLNFNANAGLAWVVATDLPKDGSLRIGVKHKVECTRKSRSGDQLSMHYTGTR